MFARIVMIAAVTFASLGAARAETHLLYLHGCCIRDASDPKAAAYAAVVEELRRSGFTVSFDLKTADVGDSESGLQRKLAATADQVLGLIAAGEFAENITVVGHGLGAATALAASGVIANRRINVILLGGCPANPGIAIDYAKVMGRFLSIVDTQDRESGSCHGRMPEHVFYKESSVSSPEGGSLFLRTDEESLRLWLDPLFSFVTGKTGRGRLR
ncbi:hypothetical protein [Sulfurisoma sediminicola]|uniref:Alpha/beta hydrolase family protein n=1 Tax=Sulfurisoma sediminicola TaxID=1381557 RepID=A0A497XCG0_9PROT|nr:hypothetical protein [Sulfurisoma sediminicola]RLJ64642.1 hypothetical protein DFR35_1283 [Sulfurisoma sediminicola]